MNNLNLQNSDYYNLYLKEINKNTKNEKKRKELQKEIDRLLRLQSENKNNGGDDKDKECQEKIKTLNDSNEKCVIDKNNLDIECKNKDKENNEKNEKCQNDIKLLQEKNSKCLNDDTNNQNNINNLTTKNETCENDKNDLFTRNKQCDKNITKCKTSKKQVKKEKEECEVKVKAQETIETELIKVKDELKEEKKKNLDNNSIAELNPVLKKCKISLYKYNGAVFFEENKFDFKNPHQLFDIQLNKKLKKTLVNLDSMSNPEVPWKQNEYGFIVKNIGDKKTKVCAYKSEYAGGIPIMLNNKNDFYKQVPSNGVVFDIKYIALTCGDDVGNEDNLCP